MTTATLETRRPAANTAVPAAHSAERMRRIARRWRYLTNAGAALISALILVWTLTPIYNIIMVSLESEGDVSVTSFSVGRMRIRNGWIITNAALMTYVIPASFLSIPFYLIMNHYGLQNNPWSVIAVLVTFATPYAIFIFQEYGRSIPIELDESARIDGASPLQIYFRIYLPLMAPALVAVGTYALLLAWNEYLYQFLLLSNDQSMTVAVALGKFLNSDVAPWNYMMATAIIYALPPLATYYAFRHRMSGGLTMGGVKG